MKGKATDVDLARIHRYAARAIFRAWPSSIAHHKIMALLNPPTCPDSTVVSRIRGYPLSIEYDPNSFIGRFIYYRGIFEEHVAAAIASYLRPGGTFIDVGANIGQHSIIAAHIVGPSGQVFAFEPQTRAYRRVLSNAARNGLSNVNVVHAAVGAHVGTARIYNVNPSNDGQATLRPRMTNEDGEEVDVVTLDALIDRHALPNCVVKIDVEGAEMDVLLGADRLIENVKPDAILVECIEENLVRFGASRRGVLRHLSSRGYALKGRIAGRWGYIAPTSAPDCDVLATRERQAEA